MNYTAGKGLAKFMQRMQRTTCVCDEIKQRGVTVRGTKILTEGTKLDCCQTAWAGLRQSNVVLPALGTTIRHNDSLVGTQ